LLQLASQVKAEDDPQDRYESDEDYAMRGKNTSQSVPFPAVPPPIKVRATLIESPPQPPVPVAATVTTPPPRPPNPYTLSELRFSLGFRSPPTLFNPDIVQPTSDFHD
jgi:hypothetical protein